MMTGSIVLLPRLLRGKQQEAKCEILARKSLSPEGPGYTDGFVLNAPPALLDGEYIVIFDHHTMRTNKVRGLWLPSTEIVRHPDE